MKVVVISVPLQGHDILQKMLRISFRLLSQDGFAEILIATLCLTADKSDTAERFSSHEDSVQRVCVFRNIQFALKGLDVYDSSRH